MIDDFNDIFSIASDIFYAETRAIALYLKGLSDTSVFEELNTEVSDLFSYLCMLKYFNVCGLEELAAESLQIDYCMSVGKSLQLLEKITKDGKFEI